MSLEITRDCMTAEPLSARVDTSLAQVAVWMVRHGIRHVPVTDHNGHAVGILTDDAVFSHGSLTGNDAELWMPRDQNAAQNADGAASSIEVTVDLDTPTSQTFQRILSSSQDVAIVRGPEGELAGLVTEHDGVRLAAQLLENVARHVGDAGSQPVATTTRLEPATHALEHMELHGVRHLLVLDPAGKLAGVITKGDLIEAHLARDDTRTVGTLLRDVEPIVIGRSQPLADAAYSMLQNHIGCLPVLDDRDHPVRILTRFDLIQAALDQLR